MYSTPLSGVNRSLLFSPVPSRTYRFRFRSPVKRYIIKLCGDKEDDSKGNPKQKKGKVKEFIRTDYSVGVAGVVAATVATRSTAFVVKEVACEVSKRVRSIQDSVVRFQDNLMKEQFDPKIPSSKPPVFVYQIVQNQNERQLKKIRYSPIKKAQVQKGIKSVQLQPKIQNVQTDPAIIQKIDKYGLTQEESSIQTFQQNQNQIQLQNTEDVVKIQDELVNLQSLLKQNQDVQQPEKQIEKGGFFGDLPSDIDEFQKTDSQEEFIKSASPKTDTEYSSDKSKEEEEEEEEAKQGFFQDLPASIAVVQKFETDSQPDNITQKLSDTTQPIEIFQKEQLIQQVEFTQDLQQQTDSKLQGQPQQEQEEVIENYGYIQSSKFNIVYQQIPPVIGQVKINLPVEAKTSPSPPVLIRFVNMVYYQWGEKLLQEEELDSQNTVQIQENQGVPQQLQKSEEEVPTNTTIESPIESIPATKQFFEAIKESAQRYTFFPKKKDEGVVAQTQNKDSVKVLEEVFYLEEDLQQKIEQEIPQTEETKDQLQLSIENQQEVTYLEEDLQQKVEEEIPQIEETKQQLEIENQQEDIISQTSYPEQDPDQISYDKILQQQLEESEEFNDEENTRQLQSQLQQVEVQDEQQYFGGEENFPQEDLQLGEQLLEDLVVVENIKDDEVESGQQLNEQDELGVLQQATEVDFVEPPKTQKRRRVLKFNVVISYPLDRGV